MANRIPLAEASGDETLSRVTYQIILGDYDLNPSAYDDPTARLFTLAIAWHKSGIIPAQRTATTAASANRTPRR